MIITILYFLFGGAVAVTIIYLLTKAYKVSKKVVKKHLRPIYIGRINQDIYNELVFKSYYQAKAYCKDMDIDLTNIYQEEVRND